MKFVAIALLACAVGSALAQDAVRSVDRPYVRPAAPPVAAPAPQPAPAAITPRVMASAPGMPVVDTRLAGFSLQSTDGDVGRAFMRWALERGRSVKWLVSRELPIDAVATAVVPDPSDVAKAKAEGSADPELVAAMVKVARSFSQGKNPIVIREYDNTIVVMPKSGSRS